PAGARLCGGVRAARVGRVLLDHGRSPRRSVDLAGRDQHEPLDGRLPDRVEQDLRALHVRRDELARALLDRFLDMRLGRSVDDDVDLGDEAANEFGVPDVTVHEREPLVREDVGEVLEVAGVRESVERDDLVARRAEHVPYDVRRDEAGAARDEDSLLPHGRRGYCKATSLPSGANIFVPVGTTPTASRSSTALKMWSTPGGITTTSPCATSPCSSPILSLPRPARTTPTSSR